MFYIHVNLFRTLNVEKIITIVFARILIAILKSVNHMIRQKQFAKERVEGCHRFFRFN